MMGKITKKLSDVFDKSQHGHHSQAKLAEELKLFYVKLKDEEREEFRTSFIRYVKPALVVFTRESAVERVLEFVARFASLFAQTSDDEDAEDDSQDDVENVYLYLFDFLLKHHDVQGKAIRLRVCQLVRLLLHVVPRDAALEEDLVERITRCLLERMYDIIPAVRAQAVRALIRLQQPTESDCPIIERYLFLLNCDDSPEVRSAVLSCITLSTRTLPDVLRRVRDEKESVRKLAYQVLAQKVSIRALTCSRRLHLIQQGLHDQTESVKNVVKTQLLQAWLRAYQGNILEVLEKLDAIGSYETTRKAVQAMFDYSTADDLAAGFTICNKEKVIDYENLTPESALYWAEISQFLRKNEAENEEHIDKILPSLTEFCRYTEVYFEKFLKVNESLDSRQAETEAEEREFIAEQLLKIVSGYDLADNAGRQCLSQMVCKLTNEVDVTHFSFIVSALARILKVLHDSDHETNRIMMAAEMIQEARENYGPPNSSPAVLLLSEDELRAKQVQLAKIKVNAIELSENLDQKIAEKEFVAAGEIQKLLDALQERKQELEKEMEPRTVDREDDLPTELSNDPATILKCLQISKEVCSSISFSTIVVNSDGRKVRKRKTLHPTLLELINTLILPSIANTIPAIREVAVECLGNCCLYSFDLSAQHLPLFLQIIQADVVEVRVKALLTIVDVLRIFGVEGFARENDNSSNNNNEDINHLNQSENGDKVNITTVILSKIIEMLDEDNPTIRYEAASGLAMILFSGRIVSPAIFSRLVLLWYNPTTQEEHNTLNKISCFLDAYPYMCRANHNCVEEAFLPTLRTLFDAPNSSPLASVSIQNVAQLMIHLTRPSVIKSLQAEKENDPSLSNKRNIDWLGEGSAHDSLAVKLCNEILLDPQSIRVGVLSRALPMLELSPNLPDNLTDLSVLCEQMVENVKNKQALRYLKKFQAMVLSSLPKPGGSETSNQDGSAEDSQTIHEKSQQIEELDSSESTFHIQRKKARRGDVRGRSHNNSIRA